MQQTRSDHDGQTSSAGPLGAGLTMIAAVALFALGGRWLDEKLGCSPLFLLIGFALGALGGFIHLVNAVSPELLPFRPKPSPASKTAAASKTADSKAADDPTDSPAPDAGGSEPGDDTDPN